jgi:hypothetical protein
MEVATVCPEPGGAFISRRGDGVGPETLEPDVPPPHSCQSSEGRSRLLAHQNEKRASRLQTLHPP